ncbi:hypothetical protein CXG81DRAFT_7246, partial [Caulochytrium protostelioides]
LRVVAVSPCGQWCAGAGDAGRVHLWHLPRGKLIHFWDAHFQAIRAMAFRPDGQALATAGDDGRFTSGRDGGDADTVTLQGHSLAVTQIAWSRLPSAPRLFSTSLDRTFRIWQPATGQCLATILFPSPLTCLAHDGAILSVALSFEETRAVSASSDGTVKIWDLASAQPV